MSSRTKFRLLVLTATALLSAPRVSRANVIGSDFQSFNPTHDGIDFVSVESARTLPSGFVLIGGFLDTAHNTLPAARDATGSKRGIGDDMTSTDAHMAIGLNDHWDFGVNITAVANASTSDAQVGNFFVQQGLTDFRAATKYRFYSYTGGGIALNLAGGVPQIQNDPFMGGGFNADYAAELIATQTVGSFILGQNIGYHIRSTSAPLTQSPYVPVGSEILGSLAVAYRFTKSNWSLLGEFYSASPTTAPAPYSQAEMTNLEVLAGVKYWGWKQLAFHAGATSGFSHGTSSPDWRVYAGLNWYPGRLWGGKKSAPAPAPGPTPGPTPEPTPEPTPFPMPIATPAPAPVQLKANDVSAFDHDSNEKEENLTVGNINFANGSAVIPNSFKPYLLKFASYVMRGRALAKLTITGHTDSTGSLIKNQELSQARAESVKRFMVGQGNVPESKIEAVGRGQTMPVATNKTMSGRELNRRVEFHVERE